MATLSDVNERISTPIPNFTARLSPTPRGARLARLLAAEQLRSWGWPLDPAELIVAELATNAATHGRVAGRSFRVTLYVVAETLRIEVTDTCGDRRPHPQRPAAEAESGRGLVLVQALSTRWGVKDGPTPRKTVWAEVSRSAPEPGDPCCGVTGGLPQGTTGVKGPHQAPPLPPAAQTHSRV